MTIPKAPKLPSDLALLEASDPVTLSLEFLARRRVTRAKAASTEPTTQLDTCE